MRSTLDGRPRPRVRVVPRAPESDGEDASFLASSYGLTPDDWQEDVLDGWLGRRRGGRWASATCGLAVPRQNGKNAVIEIRELYGMVVLKEKFLHTAHEVKTARKAFLRIASFFENERQYPELAALAKEIRKTNGQEAVVLTNGGAIEFIARSRGSGRGFTVDVLVCDEAQDLTDEELAALLPTISAAPSGNPQVILTGTPPDPDKPLQGEVFSRVRDDGEQRQDPRLCWHDYGVADGPLPDVDDRETWVAVNPALGKRLNIAEVERERRLMSREKFAHERLGWWGDPNALDGGAYLEGWHDLATATGERLPMAVGVAVSVDRAWASFGGAMENDSIFAIDRRRGTDWVVEYAKSLNLPLVIDGRGPGADLIPALEAEGVSLIVMSTAGVMDACAELYDATVLTQHLKHFNDPDLNDAVSVAVPRPVGDRWAWGRRLSAGDVSMLEAVTLARWQVLAMTRSDYDVLDSIL